MADRPIGLLDSGLGGIAYLRRIRELLPGDSFVYWADREHFPYGDRDAREVAEIVLDAAAVMIERFNPKVLVVACNTASVVALDRLRERFRIPFVGVVPAIKPAAASGTGRIGLLATSRTTRDPYVHGLISQFASDRAVELVAAGDLVQAIEEHYPDMDEDRVDRALVAPLSRLQDVGVDAVVLGCTHFIHVRDRIGSFFGGALQVVDSVEGVAQQTRRVCGPVLVPAGERQQDVLVLTGKIKPNYERLCKELDLRLERP